LSSISIKDYNISLISKDKVKDINQTDTLYCVLNSNNDTLFFNLPINKKLLKTIDRALIKVTTNKTHSVTEDAYILQDLKENIIYSLELLLYDDYVSLSLHELREKSKQSSDVNNNVKIILPVYKPQGIKNASEELLNDKLLNSNKEL